MYVQVVTYGLGMSESDYLDIANEVAPRFANLPGLLTKVWLDDPDLGRYGALYLWEDRESMERFLRSDLFEGTNPEFVEVESEGFSILENLTAQTQPVIELVESRRAAPVTRAPEAISKAASPPAKKASTRGTRKVASTSGAGGTRKGAAKEAATKKAPAKGAATKKVPAKKVTKKTTG